MNRRKFLKLFGLGAAGTAASVVLPTSAPPNTGGVIQSAPLVGEQVPPSFAFNGDSNTGMYVSGDNKIGVSLNGAKVSEIVTIRIEE